MDTPEVDQDEQPILGPRRSRLPGAVVALCCLLVAGGMYVADRPAYRPDARDSPFAAVDGAAWYADRQRTPAAGIAATEEISVESARYDGLVAVQALAGALAGRALKPYGDPALATMRFWRVISTSAGTGAQRTEVFRIDRGIERVADDDAGHGFVYTPALVELPAGVAAGSHWQSSGSAGGALRYRSAFAATAGPNGCLQATGSISYSLAGGNLAGGNVDVGAGSTAAGVIGTRQIVRTWCPGRGLVVDRVTSGATGSTGSGGSVITTTITSAVDHSAGGGPSVDLDDATPRWADPADWTSRPRSLTSSSPGFGSAPPVGISGFVEPVVTRSDELVRTSIPGDDLIGARPPNLDDGADLTAHDGATDDPARQWIAGVRMHPGGQILALAAFGDMIVVATTKRRLVAYSATGFRMWETDLGDLVRDPPVRTDADHIAAVTSTGTVLVIDVRNGRTAWTAQTGADVETPVGADGTGVAVADRSGGLSLFDAGTGRVRWSRQTGTTGRLALTGGLVLAATGDEVDGYDETSGRLRWRLVVQGQVTSLAGTADALVIGGQGGSSVVDRTGRVRAHLAGYQALDPLPSRDSSPPLLLGWRPDGLDVLDLDGHLRRSLDVPSGLVLAQARWPVRWSRGELVLTAPGWTFQELG